jgi:hypothetical protein
MYPACLPLSYRGRDQEDQETDERWPSLGADHRVPESRCARVSHLVDAGSEVVYTAGRWKQWSGRITEQRRASIARYYRPINEPLSERCDRSCVVTHRRAFVSKRGESEIRASVAEQALGATDGHVTGSTEE